MKSLFYFLAVILFASCKDSSGQPMDLVIIPILMFVGALLLIRYAYIRSRSGSEWNDPKTGYLHTSKENLPIWKIWQGVFGIALFVISIIIYFYMRAGN